LLSGIPPKHKVHGQCREKTSGRKPFDMSSTQPGISAVNKTPCSGNYGVSANVGQFLWRLDCRQIPPRSPELLDYRNDGRIVQMQIQNFAQGHTVKSTAAGMYEIPQCGYFPSNLCDLIHHGLPI